MVVLLDETDAGRLAARTRSEGGGGNWGWDTMEWIGRLYAEMLAVVMRDRGLRGSLKRKVDTRDRLAVWCSNCREEQLDSRVGKVRACYIGRGLKYTRLYSEFKKMYPHQKRMLSQTLKL